MLITLILSAGLIASAQQDVSVQKDKVEPIAQVVVKNATEKLVPKVVEATRDTLDENVEKIIITDGVPVWVNEKNEVIDPTDRKVYRIQVKGDTIIHKGDSMVWKSDKKGTFVYKHNGEVVVLENMPELELAPMPEFPKGAMAPMMDFEVAVAPQMDFEMAPMPDFEFEMAPVPDFEMAPMPPMEFGEGVAPMVFEFKNGGNWAFSTKDTIGMTKAEKEKWQKEMELHAEQMAKRAEEWAAKWEENGAEYELKMKEWEEKMAPKMQEFEKRMEEWQKAYEPKLEAFEKKMQEWQKANEPKMKEFEAKMKAWQDENEPLLKEYEEKMKAWEKEMQPKMEEYQRKMEVWQKENAAKIEEFQKKLQEELKKKDDNQ